MNGKTKTIATVNQSLDSIFKASSTPTASGFRLELLYPHQKHPIIAEVGSEAECVRLIYFRTRSYIIEKLSAWLRQRMYTAQQFDERKITEGAAKLLIFLVRYSGTSMFKLCHTVHLHKADLQALAPHEWSRFYNQYQQVIVPIIRYCENFNSTFNEA